jgi:hypothetical protein
MNWNSKLGLVLALTVAAAAAGPAFATRVPGQGGKEPLTPAQAQRRAARQQARKSAKQQQQRAPAASAPAQSGPNARAGTPHPGMTSQAPPAGSQQHPAPQAGGQSGPNARAGTPRQNPGGAQATGPASSGAPTVSAPQSGQQAGGQSGANARAGTMRQAPPQNSQVSGQHTAQNLPEDWQKRLQQMTPQEREHFWQNDDHFHNLPPEQQEQIKRNFEEWKKLSPQQKEKMTKTAETLSKLTPDQLRNVRTQLLPQWRQMTPERRQDLRQRLSSLNGLSDAERSQRLNDPSFYQGLSPQEHGVLKQLGEMKLNPGGAE